MAAAWADRHRKRAAALDELDRDRRREPIAYATALRVFEALWTEARMLGALDAGDPLAGVDVDIALVKAIRHVRAPS